MDKLFGFGDFLAGASTNLLLVILPVLVVIVRVVAVFLFGAKKIEKPKAKKTSEQSNNTKRQKRNTPDITSAPIPSAKITAVQQKSIKKEVVKAAPVGTSMVKPTTKTNNKNVMAAAATKKGNVKEKKAAKNAEKPLDNTSNDSGEWQTVSTKKQKKSSSTDLFIQSVAEIDAGVITKTTPKKTNAKNNNSNKQAKEHANNTKKATIEQLKQKETLQQAPEVDNKVFVQQIAAAVPVAVDASEAIAATVQAASASKTSAPVVQVEEPVTEVSAPPPAATNLAFDELGDAAWTEAKTPKKSKKRALRE